MLDRGSEETSALSDAQSGFIASIRAPPVEIGHRIQPVACPAVVMRNRVARLRERSSRTLQIEPERKKRKDGRTQARHEGSQDSKPICRMKLAVASAEHDYDADKASERDVELRRNAL